jgi:hypothetical protein
MKTKVFILMILLVAFATNIVSSQSVASQAKIIIGDLLKDNNNKGMRIIGQALTTSGEMQYTMELINAQNKQEITINLPPNTYLNSNNQVLPSSGYQWVNPNDVSDLRVAPVNNSSVNYGTLPPYDLADLQRRYMTAQGAWINLGNTLLTLFTYNWVSDLNNNGSFELDEFQGKKRTFHYGEQIYAAFSFIAACGSKGYFITDGKDVGDVVLYSIQVLDASNGNVVKQDLYRFHQGEGYRRSANLIYSFSFGNNFPVGVYMITVNLAQANKVTAHTVKSLTEYFEVIE